MTTPNPIDAGSVISVNGAASEPEMLDSTPVDHDPGTDHRSDHRTTMGTHDPQGDFPPDPHTDFHADPLQTAQGIYVTIHGHFYQPPRENPYLNTIERQSSAAPFHDWNERIHYECYRPNAFARILNEDEQLIGIVNNFEYFSFNVGATLMSWLERYDLETYQRILDGDRKSCDRLQGHGNAIAQVYNHIIMPLANSRDQYTQIRWGKADFQARFGRAPEGMWLAETAVDAATLEALIAEGIRFIVLAPSQAQRCRPIPTADQPDSPWIEVGGSQIDPSQPYRWYLKRRVSAQPSESEAADVKNDRALDSTGFDPVSDQVVDRSVASCFDQDSPSDDSLDKDNLPYIDIFFYDGPISRDMGFNDVLSSSQHLASRIGQAIRGDHRSAQLISMATDGETFGHHKGGTEKALAYAFTHEFPNRGWTVTNFAHYLSLNPPTWEVELKPVTAWSCSHGVDRWQENCGCGGGGDWHQRWRRPLRDSLDWLRNRLIQVYETVGNRFFQDPWQARDEYITVILDRSPVKINRFLSRHQVRKLSSAEKVRALKLLEMQRHALLMYTSCGWFFEELSRPEGTQILRYAARAIELAEDLGGIQLEREFMKRLAAAPSNVECFQTGAEVYRQLVIPAQISLEQVAAHYAITSLFTAYPREERVYCYSVHQLDYQQQRLGNLTLAVGQIQLTSEITWESHQLMFAVLHLGGWDFHCGIQSFTGRRAYSQMKASLFQAMQQASAAQVIVAMGQFFGESSYNLQNLFAEERHRIMQLLSQETLTRLDQLYTQVYRDNYGVLAAFHRDRLDVPQELQVAAEVAITHRATVVFQSLEREMSDFPANLTTCLNYLMELDSIAAEADYLRCQLKTLPIQQTLERLIVRSLWTLLNGLNPATLEVEVEWIQRLLQLADKFHLHLFLDRAQELYFKYLHSHIIPQLQGESSAQPQDERSGNGRTNQSRSRSVNARTPRRESRLTGTVLLELPTTHGMTSSAQPRLSRSQLKQLLQLGQRLTIDVQGWLEQCVES